MTDRPSYGPVRRLSPSVSADNRKPYSRTGLKGVLGTLDLNSGDTAVPHTPDSPYYPFHVEVPQLEPPSQSRARASAADPAPAPGDGPSRDVAGFPTYEQYLRIEEEYLSSLSERKQPKALISQALFDKIFAVLQNGNDDRAGSTAQFRFWVRKMFVLAYPQTSFSSPTTRSTWSPHGHGAGRHQHQHPPPPPEPVVLHDKRPVAIREQLYEVLCYCHAVARHGGRDKTCATLRLHYSWVPKELTAKFVKSCPTCTLKRSGNPDLLSQFGPVVPQFYAPPPSLHAEPAAAAAAAAASFLVSPGGPNDTAPSGLSFVVGSPAGCDDGGGGGGGSGGFCPSIFATPDLSFSVYPSPTLSAGSSLGGPTTPSPYLPSGLFGYPAVFDPGHGSLSPLSSVTGWDPSPLSPRVQMYGEELLVKHHHQLEHLQQQQHHQQQQHQHQHQHQQQRERPAGADEVLDMGTHTRDMPLHLPVPRVFHPHPIMHDVRSGLFQFLGVANTPCPTDVDGNNIDPALLMEGNYPHDDLALVRPGPAAANTDADADMDTDMDMDMDHDGVGVPVGAGGSNSGGLGQPYLFTLAAATLETPSTVATASESASSLRSTSSHVPQQQQQQPPPQFRLALSVSDTTSSGSGNVTGGWRQPSSPPPPPPALALALLPEAASAADGVDSDACPSGGSHIGNLNLLNSDCPDELRLVLPPPRRASALPVPALGNTLGCRGLGCDDDSDPRPDALAGRLPLAVDGQDGDSDEPEAALAGYAEEHEQEEQEEQEEEATVTTWEFLEMGGGGKGKRGAGANVHVRRAQVVSDSDHAVPVSVSVSVVGEGVEEDASSCPSRSRVSRNQASSESRSRWESPEAWLVQSDSFDNEAQL